MLCNTSVIQSITKKFQEIRIIFPSYVFITEDTGGKRQTHYNIRTRV